MPKEVVLGDETRYDDYGNFWFKGKDDKEHKIGTKRKNFDELVTTVDANPGKAVKLTFGTFNKIDYIVGIELLDKQIQVDESKITEQQVAPKAEVTAPAPKPASRTSPVSRNDNIDKRCALIQATDLVKEGKIGIADWNRWATDFYGWLCE